MATGTGTGTLSAMMDALASFATSQGWTVNLGPTEKGSITNDGGGYLHSGTPGRLSMSNGICHVNFAIQERIRQTNLSDGTSQAPRDTLTTAATYVPDTNIFGVLSTAAWAGTVYNAGPGSPSASPMIAQNNLQGPFTKWTFESGNTGAGDPPYIHVIIQVNGTQFSHFSFGILDQVGLSHGGAAYFTCSPSMFYLDSLDTGETYDDVSKQFCPFLRCNTSFYVPDALPINWSLNLNGAAVYNDDSTSVPSRVGGNLYNSPTALFASQEVIGAMPMDIVGSAPTTSWSGYPVLVASPVIMGYGGSYCYIGDFPNVRLVNMTGMNPGQTITLGDDVWTVYPSLTQSDLTAILSQSKVPLTGQYGIAVKKVA